MASGKSNLNREGREAQTAERTVAASRIKVCLKWISTVA